MSDNRYAPSSSAEAMLDEFQARAKALPIQHEIPSRGCCTYNWHMALILEMRTWLAAQRGTQNNDASPD